MIGYRAWLRIDDYQGASLEDKLRSFVDMIFSDTVYARELKRRLSMKKRNGRNVFTGKRRKQLKFNLKRIEREE